MINEMENGELSRGMRAQTYGIIRMFELLDQKNGSKSAKGTRLHRILHGMNFPSPPLFGLK